MKIAYVCHWNPFVEDGVVRKIRSQVGEWQALGADVGVFCLSAAPERGARPAQHLPASLFLYRNAYLGRIRATLRVTRAVARSNPDVVYLRYSLFLPPPVRLMQTVRTVVEVNSDDRQEYLHRSRKLALYNDLNRRLLFKGARGFVSVTQELSDYAASSNREARRVTVTNGVNLRDEPPLPPAANARPRLVFLGVAPEPWHGVDKILWLAAALPEFDFDIVCPPSSQAPPVTQNVHVHGFLEHGRYEAILANADVALGTLALHRKGMQQAAPLKVREYLVRGIPTIIGYDDPDLDDDPWFVLKLPNTESNVRDSVGAVRAFVLAAAGRRIERAEIAHRIDIGVKEKRRVEFLEEIVTGKRSGDP